jgi:crotonobetainyl-CoA:carnitine CoA-transferase CaiB-like acyl-CoA transferase
MIGRPDLDIPRYKDTNERLKDGVLLDEAMREWLMQHTATEVYREAQRRRIPFGVLSSAQDLLDSPHLRERSYFRKVRIGERWVDVPGLPFAPLGTTQTEGVVPRLGEHNDAVLGSLPAAPAAKAATPAKDARSPLDGIRVLDLTHVWAGPKCTQILAYLGAEVIKVESPNRPDMARGVQIPSTLWQYPNSVPGERPYNRAANFNSSNRRKRAINLDLRNPRGLKLLKELVAVSDVVVENFSVGVVDRLGLGYDVLREIKPDIVMVSMPGFGSTGSESSYVSFASTISSTSGVLSSVGYPGELPMDEGLAIPDPFAGNVAAAAIITALHDRALTGAGRYVEVAQREALIGMNALPIIEWQLSGEAQQSLGNRDRYVSPQGAYPASGDDMWVVLTVGSDAEWRALCGLIGQPDWAGAQRFATASARAAAADEIDAAITTWTASRTAAEATAALQAKGIAAGVVVDDTRIVTDPHLEARGFFETTTHPDVGEFRYPVPLGARFREHPIAPVKPAPIFGQHNHAVLSERLGLSDTEIQELEREVVIAADPTF